MRGEAGYVAADALAALAILGLAVGGLMAGIFTLGRNESATTATLTEGVALRTASKELRRILRDQGPFRSDADAAVMLTGSADRFDFPCGEARCAGEVAAGRLIVHDAAGQARTMRLPGVGALRFAYVGSQGRADRWPPPVPPPPARQWQVLQAVVVEEAGRPLLVGRLAVQQVFDCAFDAIIQDCRKVAP